MNVTKSLTSNVTKIANTIKTGAINATAKISNVGSAIKQKTNAVTNTVQKKVDEEFVKQGKIADDTYAQMMLANTEFTNSVLINGSDLVNKLADKYDLVKYNSNYNLLLNSFEHVTSILEDISNEN